MAREDTGLAAARKKHDPRRDTQLRIPQVNVLRVLASAQEPMPKSEITKQAGYTALSGTASRALYGVPEGSSSGAAQVGLISLGYVREDLIQAPSGGWPVKHFSITDEGKRALAKYMTATGGQLPEAHPAPSSPNPTPPPGQANPASEEKPMAPEGTVVGEQGMRALTLKPEPAELVASGDKTIENRSWQTHYRGPLAIHRGGKDGAIIAVVDVVDCIDLPALLERIEAGTEDGFPWEEDQDRHARGPWCWILKNVRRVDPPIPCKGKLNLWRPSAEVAREVQARRFSTTARV